MTAMPTRIFFERKREKKRYKDKKRERVRGRERAIGEELERKG